MPAPLVLGRAPLGSAHCLPNTGDKLRASNTLNARQLHPLVRRPRRLWVTRRSRLGTLTPLRDALDSSEHVTRQSRPHEQQCAADDRAGAADVRHGRFDHDSSPGHPPRREPVSQLRPPRPRSCDGAALVSRQVDGTALSTDGGPDRVSRRVALPSAASTGRVRPTRPGQRSGPRMRLLSCQLGSSRLPAGVRRTLRISCEGRTTLPWFAVTGPTMMPRLASNRPSSAASACSAASLSLPTAPAPASPALRQIVRLIHSMAHAYATREGVARRDPQAGKDRRGCAAPCEADACPARVVRLLQIGHAPEGEARPDLSRGTDRARPTHAAHLWSDDATHDLGGGAAAASASVTSRRGHARGGFLVLHSP